MPPRRLYDLKVTLVSGPAHAGPIEGEVSRTIQIRGDLKLSDLHGAVFDAFDREEEHMYEFVLDGDEEGVGPTRYTQGADLDGGSDVNETSIASLGLKVGGRLGYAFDFGDRWVHTIEVVAFEKGSGFPTSPTVIDRVGDSPPQYPD